MWTLKQLVEKARQAVNKPVDHVQESLRLLGMDELISDEGHFEKSAHRYFEFREKVAKSIVALKGMLSNPVADN